MTTKKCRHCDIGFYRDDAAPIPHDRCERCHEEIEAFEGPSTSAPRTLKVRTAGLKFDADKPRMELLIQGMPRALEAVGAVLTFGAIKYSRTGINYNLGTADKVFELCHAGIVEKVIRLKLRAQENVGRATPNEKIPIWDCVSYALTEDPLKSGEQGSAGLAMRNDLSRKTLIIGYDSLKIGENGELKIPRNLLPMPKRGKKTPQQDSVIKILNGITNCGNSDLIKEIMIVFLNQDVRYAAEKTGRRTLTTAMTQASSVDSFAVVATTDWECWETTYKVLKELSLISSPLKPELILGAHSWKHVEDNHNRYWAAKTRHELARAKGEQRDPETGMLHLAHEACNALFLLELALMELEQ